MMYLTQDAGIAIGNILSSILKIGNTAGIELKLTADELTTMVMLSDGRKIGVINHEVTPKTSVQGTSNKNPATKSGGSSKRMSVIGRLWKGELKNGKKVLEYDGESLTIEEWAQKLGITPNGVRERIKRTGNPYNRKGPSDADKLMLG